MKDQGTITAQIPDASDLQKQLKTYVENPTKALPLKVDSTSIGVNNNGIFVFQQFSE